ncbi:MAG: dihydroorotate dehydrogenase electron transfer subunit [bacterium]
MNEESVSVGQDYKCIDDCAVLSIENLSGDVYCMRLAGRHIAHQCSPGQFVNLKVTQQYIPFLRKPFSVCRRDKEAGWFEILWKIVGTGTAAMARAKPGDTFNVIGPLGRGYREPQNMTTAILVGGGLGIAPLLFLCEELRRNGVHVEVFFGARSASDLAMVDVFQEMDVTVTITTEDGSAGTRGVITEALIERLNTGFDIERVHLFSCGPTRFLQSMIHITETFGIEGQIAIETMMACGFGICVGCPVRAREPKPGEKQYKLTCIEGPVFGAREVVLDG